MDADDPAESLRWSVHFPRLQPGRGDVATWTAAVRSGAVSPPEISWGYGSLVIEPNETIERAYRVRLRPTRAQMGALQRMMGARRFVWNWAMRRKDQAWRDEGLRLNWVALSKEFTLLKTAPETAWLAELPREPFQQTLRDFDRAWTNFFAKRASKPRKKKHGVIQSLRFTLDQRRVGVVDIEAGAVKVPGLGSLRFRVSELMPGRLRSVTISRDAAGRWFGSFAADGVPAQIAASPTLDAVGVDLGLKDSAVLCTGEAFRAAKHLASKLNRLRRYQRRFQRQQADAMRRAGLDPARPIPRGTRIEKSGRMLRQARRIGRLHAGISDARRNHQHQLTHAVTRMAAVVSVEDLAVKAMARGMGRRAFRRGVADAGLGEIRRQLEYKAAWRGRVIVAVDRFFPSSKTCSACGHVKADLRLNERSWVCASCGATHDRDHNAAKNIRQEGIRIHSGEEPSTRRSRGIDARGEAVCAAGGFIAPAGLPTSKNRELISCAPVVRVRRAVRDGTG